MSELGFDPSLKKKKKSKKTEETSLSPEAESAVGSGNELDDMLVGLKKKKKSKKPVEEFGESEKSKSPEADDLSVSLGELSLKKKKKKASKNKDATDFEQMLEKAGVEENIAAPKESQSSEAVQASLGLPYDRLLSRFFFYLKTE